jgi:cobalamin biosynthesis protein CbiG
MANWFALGVGLTSAADPKEVAALVDETLRTAGIPRDAVRVIATVDTRADHPALAALGWPIVSFPRSTLADRVAEPAALLAAGPGATLVVPKRRSARATVAVARMYD